MPKRTGSNGQVERSGRGDEEEDAPLLPPCRSMLAAGFLPSVFTRVEITAACLVLFPSSMHHAHRHIFSFKSAPELALLVYHHRRENESTER